MHSKASLALSIGVMAVAGYGVFEASAWPWKAALFPLVICVPLFCLAATEALWVLFGSPAAETDATDFQLSGGPGAARRTLAAIGWMLGFFAVIVLAGFPVAVPLFVLLYLRLQGGERWALSIVTALVAWAVFYGLFDYLLHVPFPAGWVASWLGFA